jgi:hypothetical protein
MLARESQLARMSEKSSLRVKERPWAVVGSGAHYPLGGMRDGGSGENTMLRL